MKLKLYIVLFAVLIVTYLAMSLLVSPPKQAMAHYNLTPAHAKFLTATVVIPIAVIYSIGAFG